MKELIKNVLNYPASLINKISFFLHKAAVSDDVEINGRLRLYGKGRLYLGDGVKINSRFRNNPIGGQTYSSIYIKENAIIKIGKNTGLSNVSLYAAREIRIGEYTKIGGSVKIYDTDFHSLNPEERLAKKTDIANSKSVIIGDHVFIGAGTIILKGVIIGNYSIIGAGSVVTKSIPEGEVWGGNPARFIRKII